MIGWGAGVLGKSGRMMLQVAIQWWHWHCSGMDVHACMHACRHLLVKRGSRHEGERQGAIDEDCVVGRYHAWRVGLPGVRMATVELVCGLCYLGLRFHSLHSTLGRVFGPVHCNGDSKHVHACVTLDAGCLSQVALQVPCMNSACSCVFFQRGTCTYSLAFISAN